MSAVAANSGFLVGRVGNPGGHALRRSATLLSLIGAQQEQRRSEFRMLS